MFSFACPACKKQYRVGDKFAGKKLKIQCKACDHSIVITVPTAAAPEIHVPPEPPSQPMVQAPVHDAIPVATLADVPSVVPVAPVVLPAGEPGLLKKRPVMNDLIGTTSELRFTISQRPDYSIVSIDLPAGKKIFAEPSAMVSMTPSVTLEAGFKGGLGKTLGRMLGGESLIINTFTAQGQPGEIMFAGGAAGDIAYQRMEGQTLYLQRGAYMLNTEGVEVTGKWQGAKGFFGGEGLVLLKASGHGDLFFNSYGAILEIDVKDGFIVDSGYIVAFEETLDYQVTVLPGLRSGGKVKSFFFGGEGLVCQFSGVGKVWIQTRHVQSFLSWSNAFRPARRN